MTGSIPFIDLRAQRRRLGRAIETAISSVIDSDSYIMGPAVHAFEEALADFCGAKHTISCANGTDALAMVLLAKAIKPRDAILCPSFTFAATAEAVAWLGATPIFVDVLETTFAMDGASLESGIRTAREAGLRPVGVISVDLFGQPADYDVIERVCAREGLWLLCDAAQGFGATYRGRKVGTIGAATTTSFFPAKPLGCYGDGGAVLTDDDELAELLRSIRVHGQGANKYDNVRIGLNARLDTIQAAVLLEKLKLFPEEIDARQRIAMRYDALLSDVVVTPAVLEGATSVWAQYTVRLPGFDRSAFQRRVHAAGVPTAIYYPKPLHQQVGYSHFPASETGLKVSERLADEVVSLPMHPYLTEEVQDLVVAAVRESIFAERPLAAAE